VKVGDLIKLHESTRRNGKLAGKLGLVVRLDAHNNPVVNVGWMVKAFHITQIEKVLSAGR